MPTALIIQHVAFEDAGSFGDVLSESGIIQEIVDAPTADWNALDPCAADVWLIMGGPIGVYENDRYPFLDQEIRCLQARLDADKPVLGICLGSQLIARALGANVYSSGIKEIGWSSLQIHDELLAPFSNTPVLHWHGDTFDLPHGARLLASTELCAHQAFRIRRALAFQYHPEVTASGLERWFVGHTHEIHHTPNLSVTALRQATVDYAPALRTAGTAVFKAWLREVGVV